MDKMGIDDYGFDEFLKTSFVVPPKSRLFLGIFDLDYWNYLGSTELGFPLTGDTAVVSFFVSKEFPDVRDFHVSYDKKVREFDQAKPWEFHPFMSAQVLPWLYNQIDVYRPVRSTFSNYLKDYMKETHSSFWDPSIGGWRSTKPNPNAVESKGSESTKYEQAVEKQQAERKSGFDKALDENKKAAENLSKTIAKIKFRDGNVIHVDFSKPSPAKDD